MAHHIILIPGDGIGPEVAAATVRLVEASGVKVELEPIKAHQHNIKNFAQIAQCLVHRWQRQAPPCCVWHGGGVIA